MDDDRDKCKEWEIQIIGVNLITFCLHGPEYEIKALKMKMCEKREIFWEE